MFRGLFLKKILADPNYEDKIKDINKDFYKFVIEVFICDLIYEYNITLKNQEVISNDVIPLYFDILKNNEGKLNEQLTKELKSNNQKRYRVIIRNIFTSNSENTEGLQNRVELAASRTSNPTRKNQISISYKLSEKIIRFNYQQNSINNIIFTQKFHYMFNFRSYFINHPKCHCGNDENIFIYVKENDLKHIPLPYSKDIEYVCSRCIIDKNSKKIKNIFNKKEI